MKKILIDAHTHTVASGHAFSTVQDMAQRAAEIGLPVLGITEHGPALPGTCHPLYFNNLHVVPREMYGVHLLMGAELSILDTKGTLDYEERWMRSLDIVIAGYHILCFNPGTVEENTAGMIAAIENPLVNIISHPGDGTADLLFEPIVLAAKEHGKLLEINNSSLKPCRGKLKARDNNLEILRLCKQYGVPVILGSDAHISFSIADYGNIYPLLAEAEFPDSLIANYDLSLLPLPTLLLK